MSKIRVIGVIFLSLLVLASSYRPFARVEAAFLGKSDSVTNEVPDTAQPTLGQGKIGGSLLSLIRDRGKPHVKATPRLNQVMAMMEQKGGAQVGIWFDHILTDGEIAKLEKELGLKFHRVYGKVQSFSPIYSVIVPWEQITAVSELSYVKSMDTDLWPPPVPTLASSVLATRANLVWPLQDSQGRPITGKGVLIAVLDTGVDVFHPDLWQPDPAEARYQWTDGNGNGRPDNDGADRVYIPGVGNQILRFIDGDGSGLFNADTDWLYADTNDNRNRDYGRPNFSENDRSYGERIFIAADTSGNNQLDPGEELIALSVSKVYKTRAADGVIRTRGVNLIDTPRDTDGHGTYTAGVVSGGSPNSSIINGNPYYFRKYVGIAPEIVVKEGDQWIGGLLIATGATDADYRPFQDWAVAENAQVMLYEQELWVKRFLDGSEQTETRVTDLANSGRVQVLGAGNLAGNPVSFGSKAKHFQKIVNIVEEENVIPFYVPAGITSINQSLIWRNSSNNLSFRLVTPDNTTINLGSQNGSTTWDGHDIYYYRFTSESFTARFDIDIIKTTPAINPSVGDSHWRLRIVNTGDNEEVNGYLRDSKGNWDGDVEYLAGGNPNWINPSKTVAFPATADKALVVGAYWDFIGSLFLPSGRGPRVDSTPQNPRPLVDIVAPGVGVGGARSVKTDQDVPGYSYFSGTSPAAAYVAGAAALMIQADTGPVFGTHDRIEARLKATARTDGLTGDPPDANTWGAGKLNVYSAFTKVAVKLAADSVIPPTDKSGLPAATVWVDSVKNYFTGATIGEAPIPGGVGSYAATAGYDQAGVTMRSVHPVAPFNVTSQIGASETTLSGSQTGSQPQPPFGVAKLVPRLIGSANDAYAVTLSFQKIRSTGGDNYTAEGPYVSNWRRGNARADGAVDMTDALFIAQYRVELRGLGESTLLVHPVNAASVQGNDRIDINDALFIAQFRVGLRDASFNWIGGAAAAKPPAGGGGATTQNTTVEVGSATLPPGGSTQVPVTVKNVSDGWGLGTYDVKVTFNPQVVRVDNVLAGDFPNPTRKIDNAGGSVAFATYQTGVPGPMGDVVVAYLAITAVGGSGSSTPLDITINTLSNTDGGAIPATDVDGTVTVQ